jgi:hypothetical protein
LLDAFLAVHGIHDIWFCLPFSVARFCITVTDIVKAAHCIHKYILLRAPDCLINHVSLNLVTSITPALPSTSYACHRWIQQRPLHVPIAFTKLDVNSPSLTLLVSGAPVGTLPHPLHLWSTMSCARIFKVLPWKVSPPKFCRNAQIPPRITMPSSRSYSPLRQAMCSPSE